MINDKKFNFKSSNVDGLKDASPELKQAIIDNSNVKIFPVNDLKAHLLNDVDFSEEEKEIFDSLGDISNG